MATLKQLIEAGADVPPTEEQISIAMQLGKKAVANAITWNGVSKTELETVLRDPAKFSDTIRNALAGLFKEKTVVDPETSEPLEQVPDRIHHLRD